MTFKELFVNLFYGASTITVLIVLGYILVTWPLVFIGIMLALLVLRA